MNTIPQARVLVIGDVMLDHTLVGSAQRLAPEHPVPVVRNPIESLVPGGAANVAANVATLGGIVHLGGMVGIDSNSRRLRKAVEEAGIHYHFVQSSDMATTVKTRLFADRHFLARYDYESPPAAKDAHEAIIKLLAASSPVDVLVLSDYNKGMLTPAVIAEILHWAHDNVKLVLADPKGLDFKRYGAVDILTPNLMEACAAAGKPLPVGPVIDADAAAMGQVLFDEIAPMARAVLLKRGSSGMSWCTAAGVKHVPAWHPQQVFDVVGAGDVVIAALAVALGEGLSIDDALRRAACAAGLSVSRPGTVRVLRAEVDAALDCGGRCPSSKILRDSFAIEAWCTAQRRAGHRIVFTNGCYDLLHLGHYHLLSHARSCGDALIVAINTDAAVQALKGPYRPICPQEARLNALTYLETVDAVTMFDGTDPRALINQVRPEVLVKGSEYNLDQIPGSELVESWGGRTVQAPMLPRWSTTQVIERVVNSEQLQKGCDGDCQNKL